MDLDYADDLSIPDESVRETIELLEVLRVQGTRIGLNINVNKSQSQWLKIS